jgi:hypothetical protein
MPFKISTAQRDLILQWIAEGLETEEINRRAALCDEPFEISRRAVAHYRKTRDIQIKDIQAARQQRALETGLALKENRIAKLAELAEIMYNELTLGGKRWVHMVKGIGKGEDYEKIEYEEFNTGEVNQLRGVLDDIAREVGDRKGQIDIGGMQIVWDVPVPPIPPRSKPQ